MRKSLTLGGVGCFFFVLGVVFCVGFAVVRSSPSERRQAVAAGVDSDVRVAIDTWGVPHVSAATDGDLFFAAGYVQARDRLWQMEVLRRTGSGRLSEIFGKKTLRTDVVLRNLGLRRAAARDYGQLTPEMKNLLERYCRGVNAWIGSRHHDWPLEFVLMRARPEPWSILDSLLVKEVLALGLCADFPSEILRSSLVARLGLKAALEILEEDARVPAVDEVPPMRPAGTFFRLAQGASNSWVLAGGRTESGRPLLANDPHLELSLPSIWYEMDLRSPQIHVTGVTIPGVPLVVIGHNESIAWGITNSGADVEDLYVERLNPARDAYWDGGGWRSLEKDVEDIKVRGHRGPYRVEVPWTDRGPLLGADFLGGGDDVSLRWTIQDGGRLFESIYRLDRASNWRDFTAALELWDAPSQNLVYADRQGNIGCYLTGRLPVRPKAAALFPSKGWRSENQWQGYIPERAKPISYNPGKGYIVAANQKMIPSDYPYYVSCDFETDFRAERIEELLLGRSRHSVASLERIQNDVFSKRAELVLPYVRRLSGLAGRAEEARKILAGWRGEMTSGREPALFMAFLYELEKRTFGGRLGSDLDPFGDIFYRKFAGLLRILPDENSPWFGGGSEGQASGRDRAIERSLEAAVDWLEKKRGRPEDWDWMKMHAVTLRHVLGRPFFLRFFDRGPYPLDGDTFCVRASFSKDLLGDFSPTDGVSYRQIIDLSDWRKSVCVLSGGESGHVFSRHYADQVPLWLKGEYRPMLFDAEDVAAATSSVIRIRPERPGR